MSREYIKQSGTDTLSQRLTSRCSGKVINHIRKVELIVHGQVAVTVLTQLLTTHLCFEAFAAYRRHVTKRFGAIGLTRNQVS